jgi:hypothetical protein
MLPKDFNKWGNNKVKNNQNDKKTPKPTPRKQNTDQTILEVEVAADVKNIMHNVLPRCNSEEQPLDFSLPIPETRTV